MGLFLSGGSLGVVNPSYYHLVEFVVSLSLFIAVWVVVGVSYQIFSYKSVSVVEGESNIVEFMWTFFPTLLVLVLSFLNVGCSSPSYPLGGFTGVKVVGRQWYWSYGLSESSGEMYDSVIGDFVDSVDKPLRLAWGDSYCFYVTSADVIHSFSIPFLGVKVDAVPGRINQFPFIPDSCGRHVGYCSELCGAGHAYMPIVLEVVPCLS